MEAAGGKTEILEALDIHQGLNLKCLQLLKKMVHSIDPNMTSYQVAREIIEPLTRSHATSFVGLLATKSLVAAVTADDAAAAEGHTDAEKQYLDAFNEDFSQYTNSTDWADVYVCHAWDDSFVQMIDAIEGTFKTKFDSQRTFYVDILCLNMTNEFAKGSADFSEDVAAAGFRVADIGHTCLVALPWSEPKALTRSWCLWEIYSTLKSRSILSLATVPEKGKSLDGTFLANIEITEDVWSHISLSESGCYAPKAHACILKACSLGDIYGLNGAEAVVADGLYETVQMNAIQRLSDIEAFLLEQSHISQEIREQGVLKNYFYYGRFLLKVGKVEEAERLFLEAIKNREKYLGRGHPETLTVLHDLACLLALKSGQEPRADAELLYEEVLSGRMHVLGPDHPKTIGTANNFAMMLKSHGKYTESAAMFRRVLESHERRLGSDHPDTINTVTNLAALYSTMHMLDEAAELYQRAMAGREKADDGDKKLTIAVISNYAALLHARGKLTEAEALYAKGLSMSEEEYGPEHPRTVKRAFYLGLALVGLERYDDAEKHLNRALAGRQRIYGMEHEETQHVVEALKVMEENRAEHKQRGSSAADMLEAAEIRERDESEGERFVEEMKSAVEQPVSTLRDSVVRRSSRVSNIASAPEGKENRRASENRQAGTRFSFSRWNSQDGAPISTEDIVKSITTANRRPSQMNTIEMAEKSSPRPDAPIPDTNLVVAPDSVNAKNEEAVLAEEVRQIDMQRSEVATDLTTSTVALGETNPAGGEEQEQEQEQVQMQASAVAEHKSSHVRITPGGVRMVTMASDASTAGSVDDFAQTGGSLLGTPADSVKDIPVETGVDGGALFVKRPGNYFPGKPKPSGRTESAYQRNSKPYVPNQKLSVDLKHDFYRMSNASLRENVIQAQTGLHMGSRAITAEGGLGGGRSYVSNNLKYTVPERHSPGQVGQTGAASWRSSKQSPPKQSPSKESLRSTSATDFIARWQGRLDDGHMSPQGRGGSAPLPKLPPYGSDYFGHPLNGPFESEQATSANDATGAGAGFAQDSREELNTPYNPRQSVGVRLVVLQIIRDYVIKFNSHLSTGEVVEYFIKPMTRHRKCSFVQLFDSKHSSAPEPIRRMINTDAEGWTTYDFHTLFPEAAEEYISCGEKADEYITHAWNCKFCEFVRCLEDAFATQPSRTLWVDMFSMNQWKAPQSASAKSIPDYVKTLIEDIQSVSVVCIYWKNPTAFNRTWCLWEMICALRCDAVLRFATLVDYSPEINTTILADLAHILKMSYSIDVSASNATLAEDRWAILKAFDGLGLTIEQINATLIEAISDWYKSLARTVIKAKEERDCRDDASVDTLTSNFFNMAKRLVDTGKLANSEMVFMRALDSRSEHYGSHEHDESLSMLQKMADLMSAQGNLEDTERMYREVWRSREAALGAGNLETLTVMNNLAIILKTQGKLEESEDIFARVLEGREEALGPHHPDTLSSLNNLGVILDTMEQLDDAQEIYEEALEGREMILGGRHPHTLGTAANLAGLHFTKGNFTEAEQLYRWAFSTDETKIGNDDKHIVGNYHNFGKVLEIHGNHEEALIWFRRAYEGRKELFGIHHPQTQMSMLAFTDVLQELGRFEEACEEMKGAFHKYYVPETSAADDISQDFLNSFGGGSAEQSSEQKCTESTHYLDLVPATALEDNSAFGFRETKTEFQWNNEGFGGFSPVGSQITVGFEFDQQHAETSLPAEAPQPHHRLADAHSTQRMSPTTTTTLVTSGRGESRKDKVRPGNAAKVTPPKYGRRIPSPTERMLQISTSSSQAAQAGNASPFLTGNLPNTFDSNSSKIDSLVAQAHMQDRRIANVQGATATVRRNIEKGDFPSLSKSTVLAEFKEKSMSAMPGPRLGAVLGTASDQSTLNVQAQAQAPVGETQIAGRDVTSVNMAGSPMVVEKIVEKVVYVERGTNLVLKEEIVERDTEGGVRTASVNAIDKLEETTRVTENQSGAPTSIDSSPPKTDRESVPELSLTKAGLGEKPSVRKMNSSASVRSSSATSRSPSRNEGKSPAGVLKKPSLSGIRKMSSVTFPAPSPRGMSRSGTMSPRRMQSKVMSSQSMDASMTKTARDAIQYATTGGVRLSKLKQIRDIVLRMDRRMTTAQFVERIVKPLTKRQDCSFIQLIYRFRHLDRLPVSLLEIEGAKGKTPKTFLEAFNLDYAGSSYAKSQIFVCHAYSNIFVDLVEALESSFGKKDADPVFWIDFFARNLHLQTPDMVPSSVEGLVQEIGHTAAVMIPWKNPAALKRTWCLWEMYQTSVGNQRFSIALTKADADTVEKQMANEASLEKLKSYFNNKIYFASSTTSVARDKEELLSMASKVLGAHRKIDSEIAAMCGQWVIHREEEYFHESVDQCEDLVYEAKLAYKGEKAGEALEKYKKAVEMCKRVLGPQHQDTLTTMHDYGVMLHEMGNYDQAALILQECIYGKEKLYGDDHEETVSSLIALGQVYRAKKDLRTAEIHFLRAHSALKSAYGLEHPRTNEVTKLLAFLVDEREEHNDVEDAQRKVLEKAKKELGEEHPDTLEAMNKMAIVYAASGRRKRSEDLLRKTLEIRRRNLGVHDPATLRSMVALADFLEKVRRSDESEALYREALEIEMSDLPADHPSVLTVTDALANLLSETGKFEQAEEQYRAVFTGRMNTLGMNDSKTLIAGTNLAVSLLSQGKSVGAEELLRHALEGKEQVLGPKHPDTLTTAHHLAVCLKDIDKYDESEDMYRRVYEGHRETLGEMHETTLIALSNLGTLLASKHPHDTTEGQAELLKARDCKQQVLDGFEEVYGKNHPRTLKAANNLAALQSLMGDLAGAVELHRRVLKSREVNLGKNHPETLTSLHSLATVVKAQGDIEAAISMYERALDGREKVLGDAHPDTQRTQSALDFCYASADPEFEPAMDMSLDQSMFSARNQFYDDDTQKSERRSSAV